MVSSVAQSNRNFNTLLDGRSDVENLSISPEGDLVYKERPSLFGRVTASVFSMWSNDVAPKISRAVIKMLEDLNNHRDQFRTRSLQPLADHDVRYVIVDQLGRAPKALFDPVCLYHFTNLQNTLVPELGELRATDPVDSLDFKMREAIAKAKLMFMLKIGINLNKGASQSVIVSWFNKKAIGVFKPENTQMNKLRAFMDFLKYQTGCQISHLSFSKMARPRAEMAVHLVDQYLKLGITCPTVITSFENTEGSFQLFEHEMVEAKTIRSLMDSKPQFSERECRNFQIMTVLNFLCGDLDAHDENWLVRPGEDCLIGELRKIDNANSFLTKNPKETSYLDETQYAWREWKIAREKYLPEVRELMSSLEERRIEEIIKLMRAAESLAGFLTEDMIALFKQRACILRAMARRENSTPRQLGSLRTDAQIQGYLAGLRTVEEFGAEFEILD